MHIRGDCTGTCPKCEMELEYLEMELKKKQYKGEQIELEGIFTLNETEPTELDNDTLFDTFGYSDAESFSDYLIAKHFYDYEDKKSCDFNSSEYEEPEDDLDNDEKTIVFELDDDLDEAKN